MKLLFGRWQFRAKRGLMWLLIMLVALVAFELFNFSTTEYALGTLFGVHDTLGMASWATVLAIAFCGIDFAGLSRLFTPQAEWRKEPKEIWFLTLAWLLGAGMNATMTWWAVATALSENPVLGNDLVTRQQVIQYVPVFVAALVWLTRIMLIGSLAASGDHLLRVNHRNIQHTGTTVTPAPSHSLPRQRGDSDRQRQPNWTRQHSRSNARASQVRSLPRRESTWQQPAASQQRSTRPRGGMPIGARVTEPAMQNELSYVDLE